jgi:hypothetical protein
VSQSGSVTPQTAPSHVLFNGPSFQISGVQIVSDPGEVSLYLTTNRHAFSSAGTQVRTVSEIAVRLTMSPAAVERMAEVLQAYVEQQKRAAAK